MATIQKSYKYEVYRQGVYLGLLDNVTSDFSYSQDIESSGVQIIVTLGVSADTSSLPPSYLKTEAGDYITDEAGNRLLTERQFDLVGNSDNSVLVNNGNKIKVYEYSDNYPNGKLMFSGIINRWEADFGGISGNDKIDIYIISDGADLDNYIYGNNSFTLQVSQLTKDDSFGFWADKRYGQTFTTGASQTFINKLVLSLNTGSAGSRTITLKIWNNTASATIGGTPLSSMAVTLPASTAFGDVTFLPSSPITVTSSTSYFYSIEVDAGSVFGTSTTWAGFEDGLSNPYGGGSMLSSTGGAGWLDSGGPDMYFKIYSGSLLTDANFTSYEPAQMIRDAITDYTARGGLIGYTTPSIVNTGLSITYNFKSATVLEIIKKALDLSPSTYFWYVDVGSNTLFFKAKSSIATFTIIKGKHIEGVKISATIENLKNTLYLSGGNTGSGVNLYKKYTDTTSINNYGQKLERSSDNRITTTGPADAIGNSFITASKDEAYRTEVTIIDGQGIDTTLVKLGDMIGFSGFGTFVDRLLLQVVRIAYGPESTTLTLGVIPPQLTIAVEQAVRDINALETIANPTSAS